MWGRFEKVRHHSATVPLPPSRFETRSTHEGTFHLPTTGAQVEFPLLETFVVEDGHRTRYPVVCTLGFLLDLGLDWERLTEEVDMRAFLTSPAEAGSARAD